jgi:hypothetical protein
MPSSLFPATITTGIGAALTGVGLFIQKVFTLDKLVTSHLAAHELMTLQANERHQDIKDQLVRIEGKLDRAKVALDYKESA